MKSLNKENKLTQLIILNLIKQYNAINFLISFFKSIDFKVKDVHSKILLFFSFAYCFILHNSNAQHIIQTRGKNVISYYVQIKPNIAEESLIGNVKIKFWMSPNETEVIFDCGSLQITNLVGDGVSDYMQKNKKVHINFDNNVNAERVLQIFYEGSPTKGAKFFSEPTLMHTAFFTDDWMICNNSPNDKAKINIDLIVSNNLTCISNGILINKKVLPDELIMYSWVQDYETPSYSYGFVIGVFQEYEELLNGISLHYYAHNFSSSQLKSIFQYTGDILSFFEKKSGIPFPQKSYSQILIGNQYQEMSGLSILKNTYGNIVLKDSTDVNLISHELAHQWWGNMITCENWNHFWLNEGFVTYMSAAYNEYRFGIEMYQSNIDLFYGIYEKIKNKGLDKSLVFDDWLNPTRDDRNLVYYKGAYVLHLLRKKLGGQKFWKGIKQFSQQHYGKSVTTKNFQEAMEASSKQDLGDFFGKWIY